MTTTDEIYWDPFDIEIDTAPHAVWRTMRDRFPLYRNEKHDFWALSRYEDVRAAHLDPQTYSSARGTVLELMNAASGADLSNLEVMIFMDPPKHSRLRALVSKAFTRRRVGELEENVRAICREYLDPQVGGSGFDYLADFGTHLPSRVISSLLGVPAADRPRILDLINTSLHIEPGVGMVNDVALTARGELNEYWAGLLSRRREQPGDDLISALAVAEMREDGVWRRLTDHETIQFIGLIGAAGTETVARLLGFAAVVLADNPEQRAELVADPTLIPGAVEELLRYESPSPVQGRTLTKDVVLHGETVPAGSRVLLITGSAGRDERRFEDPDRFDIRRRVDQHVSFGLGGHFCLGAALARMEGRVALEETLARFPEWEVDRARVQRLHTSTVRGYQNVPILL